MNHTLKHLTEQLYYAKKDVHYFAEMLDNKDEHIKRLETELAELKRGGLGH